MSKRIVVSGLLGTYAFGGVTWDYLQYVLGFRALGHETWYVEDTGAWNYDPVKMEPSEDCSHNVNYLREIMEAFDLGDRWIFRNGANGETHGVEDAALADKLLSEADVFVNVSGAAWLREATASAKHLLYLDGDPMFTQVRLAQNEGNDFADRMRWHHHHFTFGLNVGQPDCKAPACGIDWKPTIQPVALDEWVPMPHLYEDHHAAADAFTTIMNWASYRPVEYEGELYGQKDLEFEKFRSLPNHVDARLVIAMGQGVGSKRPTEALRSDGWEILEPNEHLPDHTSYRQFIRHSKAEWSIAKNGYVAGNTGWFSCRSACYLAAGKPVVVQDTGWTRYLPTGDGVLAFSTTAEAIEAVEEIEKHYEHHEAAARQFAADFCDAPKVCQKLLEDSAID